MRMIVTDLDGTLLRDDKTVSGHTIDVLRHCREAGVKIVYATARGGSAERLVPPGLFDGRILNNGAFVFADGSMIFSRLVPAALSRPLLEECTRRGLRAAAQLDGRHYGNYQLAEAWPGLRSWEVVDFSAFDTDAEKLYMEDCGPEEQALLESLLPEELYMTVARDGLAMIMHRGATKSKALAELARHWGIAKEEIAAFGDDLNDIDLLTFAGVGVAMGNALAPVKTAADDVCPANGEDGIAVWLLKKLAAVDRPETKSALVCDPRENRGAAVLSTLKSLGVRCKLVPAETEAFQEIQSGDWAFIFAPASQYDNILILNRNQNLTIKPVLLTEDGGGSGGRALSAVAMPVNPISVANALNGRFGRAESAPEASAPIEIEGVDAKKGLALMGGSSEKYRYLLSAFLRDAIEKIGRVKTCLDAEDYGMYATHVHALKSAAGYIGAGALSEAAHDLEIAGKKGDAAFIKANHPSFIAALETLMGHIGAAMKTNR